MAKEKQKMKLWKKIVLVLTGILIAVAAYLIYVFQFKEYDTADSEVSEITRETYKIDLPDGSFIVLDEDGNLIESDGNGSIPTSGNTNSNDSSSSENGSGTSGNSGSSDSSSGNSSNGTSGSSTSSGGTGNNSSGSTGSTGNSGGSSGSGSNNGGSTGTPATTATVASIKQKYEPVMGSLQSQANGRIDALVGRAINEYQTKKANGESINYAYFYNKYSSAASELEGRTDKVFYQIISVIEKELKANGLAESHAQSFVSQYEAEKEARRDALLNKAVNR